MKRCISQQKGLALLMGLVIMAALALLALVATTSMALQLRMASNFSEIQRARLGSVEAVRQGTRFLMQLDHSTRSGDCSSGCFQPPFASLIHGADELPALPENQSTAWWQVQGSAIGLDPLTGEADGYDWSFGDQAPRFLIEEVHFSPADEDLPAPEAPALEGVGYYRILGRGSGRGAGAVSVTATIIARPWLDLSVADPASYQAGNLCADFSEWYDCGPVSWQQRR